MNYCSKCILPDTRPHLELNQDGVCNACLTHGIKENIDWNHRKDLFNKIVEGAKDRSAGYDCVIPVSGGKDSTWQVIKCLEYGLNPLAVTWKTPGRTTIGTENLENLVSLGVDHIDYQINPKVERKFMYETFKSMGSPAIPMHLALFNIPLKIAFKFDIPLVIWGENAATEYGGDEEAQGALLDENWVKKYGVTQGTTAKDWISSELTQNELTPYFAPNGQDVGKKDIRAIFLGYYFPWDPETSLKEASKHGFKVLEDGPKTGYYNYADIDDDFISIHHFLKWNKFGFTRLFDNLSIEIRNGRMTRDEAIEIVKSKGDQTPKEDIERFCKFIGIDVEQFNTVVETFRNKNIWSKDENKWKIQDFIIPDWDWN